MRDFRIWGWFCKDFCLMAMFLMLLFAEIDGVNAQKASANRIIYVFCFVMFFRGH